MMYEKIRKDILEARKAKDSIKSNLLNTLVSDAKNVALNNGRREPSDEEIMNTLKKFVKNNKETIDLKTKNGAECEQDKQELEILKSYMPEQLSASELDKIVKEIVSEFDEKSMKIMGLVMKSLKEKYDGQYDGKMASEIVKENLK